MYINHLGRLVGALNGRAQSKFPFNSIEFDFLYCCSNEKMNKYVIINKYVEVGYFKIVIYTTMSDSYGAWFAI